MWTLLVFVLCNVKLCVHSVRKEEQAMSQWGGCRWLGKRGSYTFVRLILLLTGEGVDMYFGTVVGCMAWSVVSCG